ncbi:TIGR01777 family oxidoreductase [Streptomyces triticirhizae]|uniref:TIGR01777 family protein n=1 Tax=Streptomyces triticirhizae TaxID=2483353 RepID=A0A3M2LWY2_9ACTN|nr:TIGR01777 family oxidoreductase [Streptomyces triticirhizae]RMI41636.1 TIGR01777 family protein [Streptomyces triticirhizae]
MAADSSSDLPSPSSGPAPAPTPNEGSSDGLPRRVAVSGTSGLLGGALADSLRASGCEVVRLVRRAPGAHDEARWDPSGQDRATNVSALAGCDAVVHLAGAGVGDHRWTTRYKKVIKDSRVLGTTAIAEAIAAQAAPPRVFLCGSAIGYYGDTGDRAVDEDAAAGEGFLADVCRDWEGAAEAARRAGVRTVHLRTGHVVARKGGAWGRLFPIFRAGIGGPLGNGRQYWSVISLADHLAAMRFLMTEGNELAGPVNLTGPEPVTNREVTRIMGRVLHRPAILPVPKFVLRVVVGEFAEDIVGSQRVLPARLQTSGFTFQHPTAETAIRAALD